MRGGLGFLLEGDDYLDEDERRRRALAKQRELVAGALTPDWFNSIPDLCLPPGMRVAVIGAGFAGLAAAWYLHNCGVRVTVYEAADRLGGRVQTDLGLIPGKIVEAGAELVGENHPLWGILANRFGLTLEAITDWGLDERVRFGSYELTRDEKRQLKQALPQHFRTIGAEARRIDQTRPWRSPNAAVLDLTSVERKLNTMLGSVGSFERTWFEFTLGNDNCVDVSHQSYLGLLSSVSAARMGSDTKGMLGYWLSTETHRCQGGNQQLAENIAESLPDVRLGTTVTGVHITPGYWRGAVRITALDRASNVPTREDYDFAILAIPPSVWDGISFRPGLDPASRTIQHGAAVKFLDVHPTQFWTPAPPAIPLHTPLAPNAKWDELGSVWEGTDNQRAVPPWVLTVFSGGSCVLPASRYPAQLTTLYPGAAGRTRSVFVDWPNEPFIRTGYGVPAPGQVTTIAPAQLLPHASWLYFAGEQTSSGFFGYMEGALQSGARAARDIVCRWLIPCGVLRDL